MVKGTISEKNPEQAAAEKQVDATPMGGFDSDALDAALGLAEKGLHSTVTMTLGYRDTQKNYLSTAAKVRRSKEELFVRL